MMTKLEICVDSPEGLYAAISGGADRIELCQALSLGGLTPNWGLMNYAARLSHSHNCPIRVMIRPKAGAFDYRSNDLEVMKTDISKVRDLGLEGVVFGANLDDGRLDLETLDTLCLHAKGLGLSLHRAIDLTPDPFEALDQAHELGFDTILSSGGASNALQGLPRLRAMLTHTKSMKGKPLTLQPGGGIRLETIDQLLAKGPFDWVHSSASKALPPPSPLAQALGFGLKDHKDTDADLVRGLKAHLQSLALTKEPSL